MGSLTTAVAVMAVPPPGGLARGEAHAWLADLDEFGGEPLRFLETGERERAGRYLSARDGARFAASRAVLRLITGRYLGTDPALLRFRQTAAGRLELAGPERNRLWFSLARSAGLALIAVALAPVGADIEQVRPRAGLADLAVARFSQAEAGCIARGCAGSALSSFYRHWTVKEAYLKAVGTGLAGLRDTELDCGPGGPAIRFRGRPQPGFRVCTADISPAVAAAVVASSPACRWLRLAR